MGQKEATLCFQREMRIPCQEFCNLQKFRLCMEMLHKSSASPPPGYSKMAVSETSCRGLLWGKGMFASYLGINLYSDLYD